MHINVDIWPRVYRMITFANRLDQIMWCVVLCVCSSFERELVALLFLLFSECHGAVIILCLFLTMSWAVL